MGGSNSTPARPAPQRHHTSSTIHQISPTVQYSSSAVHLTSPSNSSFHTPQAPLVQQSTTPSTQPDPTPSIYPLLPATDLVSNTVQKVRSSDSGTATPAVINITNDINNYIVDKVTPNQSSVPSLYGVPGDARCDRHILRVCHIYNQRKIVCQKYCHRLHVCLSWTLGHCRNDSCSFDHGFHSLHNQALMPFLINQRFSEASLKDQLKTNVEFAKKARSKYETGPIICPHNIMGRCNIQNCRNVHLDEKYSWEIQDGNWVRLTKAMNQLLEKAFCDPKNDEAVLELKYEDSDSPSSDERHLQKIFGKNSSVAKVDFTNMSLQSRSSKIYQVRRLSTPSDIFANIGPNTRWLWNVRRSNGEIEFLTHGHGDKFYQLCLSDGLERALQGGQNELKTSRGVIYNFMNMTVSTEFGNVEKLVRRPAERIFLYETKEKSMYFRDLWTEEDKSNGVFSVFELSVGSNEFIFVQNMLMSSLQPNIHKIFRIQNPFLWNAYQLKKRKMLHFFKGDDSRLKEQYMFHGTKATVVDQIYEGNLDWRLYGSNVGCVYGRGAYFANHASTANSYASGSPKVILMTMVLVGDACIGNKSMDFPPKNPVTGMYFDTTVNHSVKPTIFVKYNDDEYYPSYAIYYN